jgi:uncharacterized membrane protein HdeD (DUF308 family)
MSAKSTSLSLDQNLDFSDSALNDKKAAKDLWWLLAVRGLALLIFGMTAIIWPDITLYVLALIFAIFLLVQGSVSIVSGIRSLTESKAWFLRTALGFVEVGIGVYLLSSEVATKVEVFVIYLGLVFVLEGIVEIVEAFANKDNGHRLLTGFSGILAVAAGIILVRYPITAGVTFTWVIGLYGIAAGAIGFVYGLSLRSSNK